MCVMIDVLVSLSISNTLSLSSPLNPFQYSKFYPMFLRGKSLMY